jgi:alkylation response protein AidB-like acyl-CoA dehydrogenase
LNFDFSQEQELLRDQARRFLADRGATARCRQALESGGGFDGQLWREMAELGWLGAALPEQYGGAGLSYVDLCVIAEELGRANAATPFSSSVYLASEALVHFGTEEQKQQWLPKLVSGEVVGTVGSVETNGPLTRKRVRAKVSGGKLTGIKVPVADAAYASIMIILARHEDHFGLYLVEANAAGMQTQDLQMNDGSRPASIVQFNDTPAQALAVDDAWEAFQYLQNRAAVLLAFEQVGGAQACLEMARDFALERYAFGRPIGSFQAIKHKLADVYVATELARSNAYYGAWALDSDAADLPVAAAAARVAGCRAFDLASKENIQTHGGMGFTWALDCHLYYRRAKAIGLSLGSARVWKDRLIARLESRNAA